MLETPLVSADINGIRNANGIKICPVFIVTALHKQMKNELKLTLKNVVREKLALNLYELLNENWMSPSCFNRETVATDMRCISLGDYD